MTYTVVIIKQAVKELENISAKNNKQIVIAIDELSENPRPHGCKKLKGEKEYIWRIRVGDYRILYTIEDKIKVVEVRKIGHRKNVYK